MDQKKILMSLRARSLKNGPSQNPTTVNSIPKAITMFSSLKTKIYAIGAGIIGFLLFLVKFLAGRNKALKEEVKAAESQLQFRKDIDIIDAEIGQEFSHRAEEARRDVENGDIPDHLSNPDKL